MRARRRPLLAGLAASALAATTTRAQQKPARVVVLARSPVPELAQFREGMLELGWVEGRAYVIEERYAGGDTARLRDVAAATMGGAPDVVWAGHTEAARAAKTNSSTIPIVFHASDPVGAGLVASLGRPGGNATGISYGDADLTGKRIEILHDAFPLLRRLAILNTDTSAMRRLIEGAKAVAVTVGIELLSVVAPDDTAIGPAVETALREGAEGFAVIQSPLFRSEGALIAALATRHRVPSIFDDSSAVDAGGLMSYGPDYRRMARRTAVYVDRILKGARPADLPVEQQERVEFVINLRTAAALGFTIPPSLVARADRVIE